MAITAKCLMGLLVFVLLVGAGVLGYARSQGLQVLSVQTGSMRPGIQPGDAVLVLSGQARLTPGDVVSYRSISNPRATITHRILTIDHKTGQIVTKGDNLQTPDPAIQPDRIIGRVEHTIPAAGYGFDMLRNPVGLAVGVYAPSIVLISGEIQRLMRYYDQQRYRLRAYPW